MDNSNYLCIYHDKCPDGFAAAWAVYRALGLRVEFVGCQYGQPMPEVKGKHVIMVDFSFPTEDIERAIEDAESVLILDHHEKAKKALEPFIFQESWEDARGAWELAKIQGGEVCLFDMDRSGARMTWDFFFPGHDVPKMIEYVEDRDLWRHRLPKSKDINQWIMSFQHSLVAYDHIDIVLSDPDGYEAAADSGQSIRRSLDQIIEATIEDGMQMMKIGGVEMPVVNVPHALASDTADRLKDRFPVAATYVDLPQGRRFSIRARNDNDINLNDLLSGYGGGGHKKAAGVMMPAGWSGEE